MGTVDLCWSDATFIVDDQMDYICSCLWYKFGWQPFGVVVYNMADPVLYSTSWSVFQWICMLKYKLWNYFLIDIFLKLWGYKYGAFVQDRKGQSDSFIQVNIYQYWDSPIVRFVLRSWFVFKWQQLTGLILGRCRYWFMFWSV